MSQINVRIEEKTKKAASKVLAGMGLDISTGVKMFLHQVIEDQAMPFTPRTNTAALKAKWDKEVAWALKHGKRYSSAKDALRDL